MAEILIKGMEMPIGCYDCPLGKREERSFYYECNASDGVNIAWYTIPAYCPLVEVPPHGDIVDRDYIKANGLSLNDAPVILEATE